MMEITTEQIKQIIKKELSKVISESVLDPKLHQLLKSDNGMNVVQAIEIADMMGTQVTYGDLNQDTKIIRMVLAHPTIKNSEAAMRIFAGAPEGNTYVLAKVAKNSVTPVDVLQGLMSNEKLRVRAGLALNSSSTKEMLDVLSGKKEHRRTKRNVASNPNATAEILDRLVVNGIKEIDFQLVGSAAQHPNISNETLLKIVHNRGVPLSATDVAGSVLDMRGYGKDELVPPQPEMDEFEQMFGDHNEVSLPDDFYSSQWDYDSEDDDDYEF